MKVGFNNASKENYAPNRSRTGRKFLIPALFWNSRFHRNPAPTVWPAILDHDSARILSFIAKHLDEDIYFGVATRKACDGSKNGVSRVTHLWADIDWKDFPRGQAEADEAIRSFPLKPSIIVSSGHGYHLYWRLRETTLASIEIEGYLKGIAKALGADRAAAELARILRVPGRFNYHASRQR